MCLYMYSTFKNIEYTKDMQDDGSIVRKMAEQIVSLCNDEKRLKNELVKVQKLCKRSGLLTFFVH